MSIRKRLKAVVTIEVVMAIALSVVVLFLVLGLFSENIQTMATKGKLAEMNRHNDAKTSFEPQAVDPTQTQINVQMVGDLGTLAWYHSQAQATIESLGAKATLTNQELIDLARALTVFAESVPGYEGVKDGWQNQAINNNCMGNTTCGSGSTNSYWTVGYTHGIIFRWSSYVTKINLKDNNWSNGNPNAGVDPSDNDDVRVRVSNVQSINSYPFLSQ